MNVCGTNGGVVFGSSADSSRQMRAEPSDSKAGDCVWREVLKTDGFVVKAGWPTADTPDLTLKSANKYSHDSIGRMKKLYENQVFGSKEKKQKNKNGALASVPSPTEDKKLTTGLVYVNKQFDGGKECLRILQSKFNSETRSFALGAEILDALHNSSVGQATDFKQIQKLCMPFIRFKKDEAINLGIQALDLKLPFGEIEVLQENLDFIKKQLSLEEVEILSVTDPDAIAKVGPLVSVLNHQNPPSPGSPTAIFLSRSWLK